MKSNKNSKETPQHSEIENTDFETRSQKKIKKDRSSKRPLSIYDEFDDELDNDMQTN